MNASRRREGGDGGDGTRAERGNAAVLALATAAACLAFTGIGLMPSLELRSFANPLARVALETAATLTALLAAYLVYGRFRESGRRSDFLIVCALELIAFRTLFFTAYPAVAEEELGRFATLAQAAGAVLGAAVLAAGAFASDAPIRGGRRVTAVLLLLPVVIGTIATVEAIVVPALPVGVERPTDEPGYVALQVAAGILYAAAAVGFVRRAGRARDELLLWLTVGATVGAFGRFNYALFPPTDTALVYTGDVLRLAFYALLLAGAMREIKAQWRHRADAAVLEERRRLARDLHDGLAQELAFIAAQARASSRRSDDPALGRITASAERALDESRRAIAALTRPVDEPLEIALAQAAEEAAERVGARLKLDLTAGIEVSPAGREALLRIVREAVVNAGRHGRASTVRVHLSRDSGATLRIEDDGVGFDPDGSRGSGFGLVSMRERAETLGGVFRAISAPGAGTVIEVTLP